jgi:hypothetical protein
VRGQEHLRGSRYYLILVQALVPGVVSLHAESVLMFQQCGVVLRWQNLKVDYITRLVLRLR